VPDAIVTERLLLRKLQHSDAASMFEYRSDQEVSKYQMWEPQTYDQVNAFIEDLSSRELFICGVWSQLAIVRREDGEMIGDCGIHMSEDCRQAEIGITLARKMQGHGYASEALRGILDYLFGLGMHRAFCSIDPRNLPALALVQRLGFRKEAHMLQCLWFKGEWADDVICAILGAEWKNRYDRGSA
jgi:RimJ/RimL family protein N-acetyltransferase